MFKAHYSIDPILIFWKKRCPKCGNKMSIFFPKKAFTQQECREMERSMLLHGHYAGPIHGHTAVGHLRCKKCGLVLNDIQFRQVREMQKKLKSDVLSENLFVCTVIDQL